MRKPHQIAVLRRRVDQYEVMAMIGRSYRPLQIVNFGRLVIVRLVASTAIYDEMRRQLEAEATAMGPSTPVLDVVGEGPLPIIQIDRGEPLTSFHQRYGHMHRYGAFSRTSLLVSMTITCGTPADFTAVL